MTCGDGAHGHICADLHGGSSHWAGCVHPGADTRALGADARGRCGVRGPVSARSSRRRPEWSGPLRTWPVTYRAPGSPRSTAAASTPATPVRPRGVRATGVAVDSGREAGRSFTAKGGGTGRPAPGGAPLTHSVPRLSWAAALALVHAAEDAAAVLGLQVAVAVVGNSGQELATYCMDGTGPRRRRWRGRRPSPPSAIACRPTRSTRRRTSGSDPTEPPCSRPPWTP